jgi:hypothetical protein
VTFTPDALTTLSDSKERVPLEREPEHTHCLAPRTLKECLPGPAQLIAAPSVLAEQFRKQQKETAVLVEFNSQAPPETPAVQKRKDEPVIVTLPAELK